MDKKQKWILIGAIIVLAVSLYLVALSNRYMTQRVSGAGHQDIFDKWTGKIVEETAQ